MKLLLDTHIFLWLNNAPEKCSANILELCQDSRNRLFLSHASLWEMQIKQQLRKLELLTPLPEIVEASQRNHALTLLSIHAGHIYALGDLPRLHQDPFDRLLIAQAKQESMTLVSVDRNIREYPVQVVW